jgi:DNA-binding GntR family transcriptional regulator
VTETTISKSGEVTRRLERAILTGRLRPGTRLPEIRLARELGVSQASVREALQALESRGLVVKNANRGSFVIQLTTVDLTHIFQVRLELEPLACALAAAHLTPAILDTLHRCIDAMRSAAPTRDYPSFQEADLRFHQTLWKAQPNRFLERCLESICLPLFAYDLVRRYTSDYTNFERSARQHQLVLRALATGDGELAATIMRRMIRRWLREDVRDYAQLRQPPGTSLPIPEPLAFLREEAI